MSTLAKNRTRIGNQRRLADTFVFQQKVLDLGAENLVAAAVDDILLAVANTDIALGIARGDIAGLQ